MPSKFIIIGLFVLIILLLGVLALIFWTAPLEKPSSAERKPITSTNNQSNYGKIPYSNSLEKEKPIIGKTILHTSELKVEQPTPDEESIFAQKQAVMDRIQEAIATNSSESVPILRPLLASPDFDIRNQAIEAMKQINAPEAATALREAAQRASDRRDREAMLEAAAFVELPVYKPHKKTVSP